MWKFCGLDTKSQLPSESLWSFKLLGPVEEKLILPACIAVSITGQFVVSDTESCFIVIYDSDGKYLSHFSTLPRSNFYFFSSLDKYRPHDVAWLSNKRVVYTQPKGCRITISNWKGNASEIIQGKPLYEPYGVAVDRQDRIFVTDKEKGRILCYSTDGKLLRTIGAFCSPDVQLCQPHYIAVDEHETIYVNDIQRGKLVIQFYEKKGNTHDCKSSIVLDTKVGPLSIDSDGKVFQVDTDNGCVVIINTSDKVSDAGMCKLHRLKVGSRPAGITHSSTGELVCIDQADVQVRVLPWKLCQTNGVQGQ